MAGDIKWKLSPRAVNPLTVLSSGAQPNGLDSLAPGFGAITAAFVPNTTDLDLYADAELVVTFGVAPAADALVELWLARSIDAVNTEDAAGGAVPVRPRNGQQPPFVLRAVTSVQRIVSPRLIIPPGDFKVLLINASTQTFAASGNTLKFLFYREQVTSP